LSTKDEGDYPFFIVSNELIRIRLSLAMIYARQALLRMHGHFVLGSFAQGAIPHISAKPGK
jgi:hypothetical protein